MLQTTLFTLAYLSPLGESVVPAADFYEAKDKPRFLHGGCPELVRIQRRLSRKRYLNSKRTYEYERLSLDIPKKFHEILKPFLEKELNVEVKLENDVAVIFLSPVKTFRHAENTPDKTRSETS
jgi:hypothetical protein